MAERKLTLFEIHLDDATFTANATKGDETALSEEDETTTRDGNEDEAGGCAVKRAGKALLALAVLIAFAVAAGKLLGEEALDEELEDLADLDRA
jgi:hypothetical protein